ncbi:phosphatidylserine/phosphatidylglycerophosphate/cardiolipin synthase-like enzyme [Streptacidiphilus sp. BW17]|uniref:phospholipase D-like domain-containing protein DpdK n=1 Tax=unclassified Streptacidiphilus TaxID=2643834 RepID=UPI003512067A
MSRLERTVRTGARTGLHVDTMLAAALLGEVLAPSDDLWLVSPWITDVQVLDNSQGAYDAIFPEAPPSGCRLSDILARAAAAGARVHVVTRPDPHNDDFLRRLSTTAPTTQLRITCDADVHEKTLSGGDWILSGSMNFTIRGMKVNDESVTYKVGGADAAQARLDLAERWKDGV